jgi:arylsulfatase A-like enzyme
MIKRLIFLATFWAALAAVGADKPNILFIFTDDQSTRTVSSYEGAYDWVNTPNIDRLANEGVRFTQANIGSWCMASRASILTGLQQHKVESLRMTGPNPMNVYDPELCQFWPKSFRDQGYYTAHIGKWHTGVDSGYGRDWDHQIVWNRPKYPENSPYYYFNQMIEFDGGDPVKVEGYTTDMYTDWAVDFINGDKRDPEKPWYLWLCYGAVHAPFTPAERHLDDYADATTPRIADIYAPRTGKPEYANNMAFWEPGDNGEPVEKARLGKVPVGMQDLPGRPLKDWVRQYQQGVLAIDEGVGRLLEALKGTAWNEIQGGAVFCDDCSAVGFSIAEIDGSRKSQLGYSGFGTRYCGGYSGYLVCDGRAEAAVGNAWIRFVAAHRRSGSAVGKTVTARTHG